MTRRLTLGEKAFDAYWVPSTKNVAVPVVQSIRYSCAPVYVPGMVLVVVWHPSG